MFKPEGRVLLFADYLWLDRTPDNRELLGPGSSVIDTVGRASKAPSNSVPCRESNMRLLFRPVCPQSTSETLAYKGALW